MTGSGDASRLEILAEVLTRSGQTSLCWVTFDALVSMPLVARYARADLAFS